MQYGVKKISIDIVVFEVIERAVLVAKHLITVSYLLSWFLLYKARSSVLLKGYRLSNLIVVR